MTRFFAPLFALLLATSAHAQSGLLPANQVWAGPPSGGQGFARARALVVADIPALPAPSFASMSLASGQIVVGQVSGFAGAVAMSGDCTIVASGAVTCVKTNGTAFSALATTAPGTGVATALGTAVGSAGAVVVNGGVLGTPSSGVGTNLTALNATNITTGTLAVARGGADLTAWTTFAPALSCGTATFTVNSARFKTIGKTTTVSVDFTITALGTCTTSVALTLPATPQSGGSMIGRDVAVNNQVFNCSFPAASATSSCTNSTFATGFLVNERILFSGVYENQ